MNTKKIITLTDFKRSKLREVAEMEGDKLELSELLQVLNLPTEEEKKQIEADRVSEAQRWASKLPDK
jgi:hypothetical protein